MPSAVAHPTSNTTEQVPEPTIYETYTGDFNQQGVHFECALSDTSGNEGHDRLRALDYLDVDVYCICFDIGNPDSLDNIEEKVKSDSVQR